MKRLTFLFILLITVTACAQNEGPKIAVDQEMYDFGDIRQGEMVAHSYVIYNKGDEVLKITNVKAGCGCTAVAPEKNELEPGDSTKIKVEFNSAGRRGPQQKYVYVFSNDTANGDIRLAFKANILKDEETGSPGPSMKLSKNSHNFGTVKEGAVVDVDIAFTNEGRQTLVIREVETSCGCAAALISAKEIAPGKKGSVRIELDTTGRTGRMTRTVSLLTNDPVRPVQPVTLYVNVEKRDS